MGFTAQSTAGPRGVIHRGMGRPRSFRHVDHDLASFDVRWPKLLTHAHMVVFTVVSWTLASPQADHSYGEHQMSSSYSSFMSFKCLMKTWGLLPSATWSHQDTFSSRNLFPVQFLVWLNSTVPFSAVKKKSVINSIQHCSQQQQHQTVY